MLDRSNRLPRPAFTLVYKTGRRYHTADFTVITKPDSSTKVAVVVSKKVYKTAVSRNRLRRQVYEAVRLALPQLPAQSVIIMAKPTLASLSLSGRRAAIATLLAQMQQVR